MQSPDSLNQVANFHRIFQHPIQPSPVIPSHKRCELRLSLLSEELNELKAAIDKGDIIEIADALCDLQYVLSGAVLEFGLGEKFKTLFDEVQRSNMSKACASEAEAIDTVEYQRNKNGTDCYYKREGDIWLVYRKSDNKTIKSINYSHANLSQYLS